MSTHVFVVLQAFYLQLHQQVAAGSSSPIAVRVMGGVVCMSTHVCVRVKERESVCAQGGCPAGACAQPSTPLFSVCGFVHACCSLGGSKPKPHVLRLEQFSNS